MQTNPRGIFSLSVEGTEDLITREAREVCWLEVTTNGSKRSTKRLSSPPPLRTPQWARLPQSYWLFFPHLDLPLRRELPRTWRRKPYGTFPSRRSAGKSTDANFRSSGQNCERPCRLHLTTGHREDDRYEFQKKYWHTLETFGDPPI